MNRTLFAVGGVIGILAFVVLIVFEVVKCSAAVKGRKKANPFFLIGVILLVGGWALMVVGCGIAPGGLFIAGTVVLCGGVFLYVFVLVMTAGNGNYIKDDGSKTVLDNGIYGVMRHPGLWCFMVVAIGVGMISPGTIIGDVLFTLMNIAYIVLQDVVFFPIYLDGYTEYKKRVAFCIPRAKRKQ